MPIQTSTIHAAYHAYAKYVRSTLAAVAVLSIVYICIADTINTLPGVLLKMNTQTTATSKNVRTLPQSNTRRLDRIKGRKYNPTPISTVRITTFDTSVRNIDTNLKAAAPTGKFPEPGNVIHPVVRVPNWGAMQTDAEWNRTFNEMPNSAFVAVPEYNIEALQIPMATLLQDREKNESLITAKLYYSTRHLGAYDLDSGEYAWKHAGVDLKLPEGTPFTSIAGGRVYSVNSERVLGNHVIIEHRINGTVYYSIYGHMKDVYVTTGQDVRSGEVIGTVGATGDTTVPHIHLQVNIQDPNWHATSVMTKQESAKFTVSPIDFIAQF